MLHSFFRFGALCIASLFLVCVAAVAEPIPSITGPVAWSFSTGKDVTAAPVIDRGVVYCGSTNGSFFALDLKTGQLLWKFDAPFPISSRAAVQGDVVCIESGNQLIALERKSGGELWRFVAKPFRPIYSLDLTDYHRSSPVISDSVVYFGDDWGNLNGVELASGKLVFQFTTESGRPIRTTPAIGQGRVFFGDWEGDVYAVSLAEKKLVWTHRAPNVRPYYGAVVSEFKIREGVLYFGSQHDVFEPLDIATGKPVWSYAEPRHTYLPTTPLLLDGKVVIGTTIFTNSILCLDHGELVWSCKGDGIFFTAPLVSNGLILANSSNFGGTGFLHVIEAKTGTLVNKLPIEKATASSPALADGLVVLGAGDGSIYALAWDALTKPAAK
jgi:outer membrane protein assembly factor BamB